MDELRARAHFTSGTQTISATLRFDAADHLVDFVSDDRSQLSADGKSFPQLRFTTPATNYRRFGPYRQQRNERHRDMHHCRLDGKKAQQHRRRAAAELMP